MINQEELFPETGSLPELKEKIKRVKEKSKKEITILEEEFKTSPSRREKNKIKKRIAQAETEAKEKLKKLKSRINEIKKNK